MDSPITPRPSSILGPWLLALALASGIAPDALAGPAPRQDAPPAPDESAATEAPDPADASREAALRADPDPADASLEAALTAAFERVERLATLDVRVGSGVVTLRGRTGSATARDAAEEIARGLPGVLFVDNLIEVVEPEGAPAVAEGGDGARTARDEAIESELQAVFDAVDSLRDITVHVRAGVVHLAGETVTGEAEDRAVSLAESTDGVVFVDSEIVTTRDLARRLVPSAEDLTRLGGEIASTLPLVLVAILVLVLAWWISGRLARLRLPTSLAGDRVLIHDLVRQVLRTVVILVGVFVALEILDATAVVGAVLGAAGLVGLALGLAFREILENYLASLLLSVRRPFHAKDMVEIGDTLGKVIRLTTSETVLLTLEGNHVRLPNSEVFRSRIVNYTRNPLRRFDFGVGLGAEEDLGRAQDLGLDALRQVPGVLVDPPPFALVEELGDSNVVVRYFGWVDQREVDFGKVRSQAITLVKSVLDEEGLDMPVPIQEIRLRRAEPPTGPEAERRPPDATATMRRVRASDVSVDDELEEQIDRDNARAAEQDLLGGVEEEAATTPSSTGSR